MFPDMCDGECKEIIDLVDLLEKGIYGAKC